MHVLTSDILLNENIKLGIISRTKIQLELEITVQQVNWIRIELGINFRGEIFKLSQLVQH